MKELDGVLGSTELESAAEVMLLKSARTGVPFERLEVYPREFDEKQTSSHFPLIGFCMMIDLGLVQNAIYPHSVFIPTKKLVGILRRRGRGVWDNMKDPPTLEEHSREYVRRLEVFWKSCEEPR